MACELVTLPSGSEAAGIGRIVRACELVASSGSYRRWELYVSFTTWTMLGVGDSLIIVTYFLQ